jgi:hypothetical protein
MRADIRDRLLSMNPWLVRPAAWDEEIARRIPDPFVPRMLAFRGPGDFRKARLIVGPRQAGKSTFVWSLLRDRDPRGVLFLNAEEGLVRTWTSSAAGVLADLRAEFPLVRTVFIDEAQRIDDAGLFVKGLVDAGPGLDLWVTGSSSFHLMDRTRESLAGRAEREVLLPFSVGEIVEFEAPAPGAVRTAVAAGTARRMLVLGGYPGAWFHRDPAFELGNLVEAFVMRDASDLFRVRRIDAFRRLLQLLAGQIGQMASYSEWSRALGISVSTVREYLALLEETWVVHLLPAFAGGRRSEITSAPRVHFHDIGIRNAVAGATGDDVDRRPDRGALYEGLVFSELMKARPRDWTIHYWRTKGGAEVDFVLAKGERTIGVEVKAGPAGPTGRSPRSFIEAYEPEAFVFVHGGPLREPAEDALGRTRLLYTSVEDLAARLRDILSR